jgi:signal transduction histidine kinase
MGVVDHSVDTLGAIRYNSAALLSLVTGRWQRRRITACVPSLVVNVRSQTVNATPFRPQDAAEVCDTNLYELVQVVCLTLSRRLRRQRVSCSIDVEHHVQFPLNSQRVTELLEQMVVDSLRAMPEGGELDVTAVVGQRGLEIEVADSGIGFEPAVGLRLVGQTVGTFADPQRGRFSEMRIETLRCPQGGTARTLFIPWPTMKAAA